jgi:hypothetical protein
MMLVIVNMIIMWFKHCVLGMIGLYLCHDELAAEPSCYQNLSPLILGAPLRVSILTVSLRCHQLDRLT